MKFTRRVALAATLLAWAIPVTTPIAFASTPPQVVQTVNGVASWYGGKFHGRLTANGERYNMHELTAAHRSLPFGTLVRVTNASTGDQVVVRINDRGPFSGNRVIDLSRQAATQINMINSGVARVTLEVLA
jgi:rare lipoprotein A